MRIFVLIFLIFLTNQHSFGQIIQENYLVRKRTLLIGAGIGTKSHFGNCGITANKFFSKNLSLKISGGFGQFNFNGFVFSTGPEFCTRLRKRHLLYLGSMWTIGSRDFDTLDDELPTEREYNIRSNQFLRTYIGFGFARNDAIYKLEIGYSKNLYSARYTLYNNWTPKQIGKLEKAMTSGLIVSCSVCFIINRNRK